MTTANFYLGSLEKTASLVALWFVVRQPHVTCYVILCYAIFLTKKDYGAKLVFRSIATFSGLTIF